MLVNAAFIGHVGVGTKVGLLVALIPEIQPIAQQDTGF